MNVRDVVSLSFHNNERYVIARLLAGGMGSVLQLVPVNPKTPVVALKTVQAKASIRAFDAECDAWMSVAHHPNVARARSFGSWNGTPSIIMDWYPRALANAAPHQFSDDAIERLFFQTAAALAYAYSTMGLIHQDIKPANILLDEHDQVKLGDFGLARCIIDERRGGDRAPSVLTLDRVTTDTGVCGTPFFMALELWRGARPSVASDIFSLGTTFYYFLTGKHPYVSETGQPIAASTRTRALQRAVQDRGQRIQSLGRVIDRCIALEPGQRFRDYEELFHSGREVFGAHDSDPGPANETVVSRALLQLEKGQPERAFEILGEALARNPRDAVVLFGMAQMKGKTGDKEGEVALLSDLFGLLASSSGRIRDRLYVEPAVRWARINIDSGRFDDAERILETVLSWYGSPAESLWEDLADAEVGLLLLQRGEFRSAAEHLARVVTRKNTDEAALRWLVASASVAYTLDVHSDVVGKEPVT